MGSALSTLLFTTTLNIFYVVFSNTSTNIVDTWNFLTWQHKFPFQLRLFRIRSWEINLIIAILSWIVTLGNVIQINIVVELQLKYPRLSALYSFEYFFAINTLKTKQHPFAFPKCSLHISIFKILFWLQ